MVMSVAMSVTMPVSCCLMLPLTFHPFLQPHLIPCTRPVVLDAAYLPKNTALLTQARAAGCPVVRGVEMLISQGIAQQQIFTNQHPAADVISHTVLKEYESMTSQTPMAIRSRAEPNELSVKKPAPQISSI